MNDTPRTDAASVDAGYIIASHSEDNYVPTEFARTLERELANARTRIGVCSRCNKEYQHDVNEPFAYCDCGTTEWPFTDVTKEPLCIQVQYISGERDALRTQLETANRDAAVMRDALESIRNDVGRYIYSDNTLMKQDGTKWREIADAALSSAASKDYGRRNVLEKCIPILEAHAALNPRYMSEEGWQDPNGVHDALAAARAELNKS